MLCSTYLLIADHLKAPLHPNYIRLITANNAEIINRGYTLITYTHTFNVVESLAVAFPIDFNFVTLYKVGYTGMETERDVLNRLTY